MLLIVQAQVIYPALHFFTDGLWRDNLKIAVSQQNAVQLVVGPYRQTDVTCFFLDPYLLARMYRFRVHAILVVSGPGIIEIRPQDHGHRLLVVSGDPDDV